MTVADLTVYGTTHCSDCVRSKRFLTERGVAFDWVDLDSDAKAVDHVLRLQGGARRVPTIVFADGSILVEPSNAELAAKLGLSLARDVQA